MNTRTVLFETLIVVLGVASWVGLIAIFGHVSGSTWRSAIVANLVILGTRRWLKQPWSAWQIFALHCVALPAGPLSGILFWDRLGS